MMLSEKRITLLKALGLRVPVVQGSAAEQVVQGIATEQIVQGSAMRRYTKIPIAGNTKTHKTYNELLRKIARHKQFFIPIPDELLAEFARIAAEIVAKAKNNVVPRIGKEKDRMHGLESGATMPRIGKVKYLKHGL